LQIVLLWWRKAILQWDAKSIGGCAGRLDARKLVRGSLLGPQYLISHLYQADKLVSGTQAKLTVQRLNEIPPHCLIFVRANPGDYKFPRRFAVKSPVALYFLSVHIDSIPRVGGASQSHRVS
jgi:hypothetical protein